MALFWRIWAVVTLVGLTVVALFTALATLQFAGINASLASERLEVLARRTASPFEQAVRIGLPLDSVRNAEGLIERAQQSDDSILAIHVFRRDGAIAFSTAPTPPGKIPDAVSAARRAAQDRAWFVESGTTILSGVEVLGQDGRSAGGVLIEYPAESTATRVWAMVAELGLGAAAALVGTGLVAAALLRLGLAREIAQFRSVDEAVDDFERAAWRSAAGRPPSAPDDPTDLQARLERAEARYRAAGQAIRAAHEAQP
ncbi:MAG: hypothetical protein KDG55_13040 [Rhodocyclaceae bacterium]|nr:hypothetical protein [Rhodocyclaceae bacterium]